MTRAISCNSRRRSSKQASVSTERHGAVLPVSMVLFLTFIRSLERHGAVLPVSMVLFLTFIRSLPSFLNYPNLIKIELDNDTKVRYTISLFLSSDNLEGRSTQYDASESTKVWR